MKELLKKYPEEKVNIYISYLNRLKSEKDKDGKLKNWWYDKISKQGYADAFIKVAANGLYVDGDTITLNYRKKLITTYDYHAYQNKIKLTYPETIFDFSLVHKEDVFKIRKESGKVIYSHEISNPFAENKDIIGAYGVIKNSKGEFIETINLKDIEKMKNCSMMQIIWNTWFDRMVLKSVIKRICATHFKDELKDIDTEDNLQNNPNLADNEEIELTLIQKDAIAKTHECNESDKIKVDIILKIKKATDEIITEKILPYILKKSTI